jgi:DNA-binding response OmpR family regulator
MNGKLMIVDDQEPIVFSVHDYFTEHGWDVDCARATHEAQALANTNDYDVVITDLHLTGIDGGEGLELVSYLRARGTSKVIVFTAYGTAESERAALQRGAHAFVQKTTPISEIAQLVARLVRTGSPSAE